jgi:hypothetical protein
MTASDKTRRSNLVKSVAIVSEYHWMFLRRLDAGVEVRLGPAGLAALERGLWRYGYSRGEFIRDSPATIADDRGADSDGPGRSSEFGEDRDGPGGWQAGQLLPEGREALDVVGDHAD